MVKFYYLIFIARLPLLQESCHVLINRQLHGSGCFLHI